MDVLTHPTEDQLRDALRTVIDPELGVDIVALGLVQRLAIAPDGGVYVEFRPTSPSCPVGDLLVSQAGAALAGVPNVGPITVVLDRGLTVSPSARANRLGVAIRTSASEAAPTRSRRLPIAARRAPFVLLGLAALVAGVWGGIVRTGGAFPLPAAGWLELHGPLMVSGFLGTVICLERAVGVGWRLAWLAPLLSAAGALLLVLPIARGGPLPAALITGASAALTAIYATLLVRGARAATAVEALGALAWLGGNLAWLTGAPFFTAVPWWLGFLVLTIVGERIELSFGSGSWTGVRSWQGGPAAPAVDPPWPRRTQVHDRYGELASVRRPLTASALLIPAGVLLIYTGALAALFFPSAWPPLVGAGLVTLAIWLFAADVARETVRQPGLPRFTAWCLLTGYGWLALGGVLMIVGVVPPAGFYYDAVLHAVFVGFVIAMIFGHAPIIFPAVLRRTIPFTRAFYLHLVVLEVAMMLRLVGDLAERAPLRTAGAHATMVALIVFIAATVTQVVRGRHTR